MPDIKKRSFFFHNQHFPMQEPYLAGSINEWDTCPMKLVVLPTGAQVNVVKEASTGNFYAIDNNCAHKLGSLCLGDIEDLSSYNAQGLCVRCPKHQEKFCGGLYFDLHTGWFSSHLSEPKGQALTKAPTPHLDSTWKLSTFDVKAEGDQVCIILAETYLKVLVSTTPSNGVAPLQSKGKKVICAPLKLSKITQHNYNTNIYEFSLPGSDYPYMEKRERKSSKCFQKAFKKGKGKYQLWHLDLSSDSTFNCGCGNISREYTPISNWESFFETKTLTILIKLYPDGLMSQKLATMKVGDVIYAAPPHKTVTVPHWPNGKSEVTIPSYGFIAGGTGIAPVYQLILRILERLSEERAAPKLTLLFSNRLERDVLLFKELKEIEAKHPENFQFEFTLTGEKKEGFRFGRVNSEMVSEIFPTSTTDHVFVSGPAGMWESVFSLLQAIGFSESDCTELEA